MIGASPVGFSRDEESDMVLVDQPGSTVCSALERRTGRWVVVRKTEVRTV